MDLGVEKHLPFEAWGEVAMHFVPLDLDLCKHPFREVRDELSDVWPLELTGGGLDEQLPAAN
jgi:hypothetical protein